MRAFFIENWILKMLSLKTFNRFQAFGLHVLISACLVAICYVLVFLIWYPGLTAYASNVSNIFLLLLFVDVVIGPIITLVIYNPQKKELKRDLRIIGLLQMLALLYGLHTVFIVRPVYLVFNAGQFDLTYANQISEKNTALVSDNDFRRLPILGPKLVSVELPKNPQLLTEIILSSLQGGDDTHTMPQYFVTYTKQTSVILASIKPLDNLAGMNKDNAQDINALISKYQGMKLNVGYLPLKAKSQNLTVIVSRTTGEILEMSILKPLP